MSGIAISLVGYLICNQLTLYIMGTIVAKVTSKGTCMEVCEYYTHDNTVMATKVGSLVCQFCHYNKTAQAFKASPLHHVTCKYIVGRDKVTDEIIWRKP